MLMGDRTLDPDIEALIRCLTIDEPIISPDGNCVFCGHYQHLFKCPWMEARELLGLYAG